MEIKLSARDERTIGVRADKFTQADLLKIKEIEGRKWVPEEGVWSFPYTILKLEELLNACTGDEVQIDERLVEECPFFREWMERKGSRKKEEPDDKKL
ncbi:hypothetical protein ACE6ED_18090 [Paenibacillus sp. CN-4]|uniref:hypothetical protein n=1 Tax=Paenibacillus nanchangensis TaxID=3348343 RepID=UPI00397A6AF0